MATAFEILFLMTLFVPALTLVVVVLAIAFVPRRRITRPASHTSVA